MADSKDEIRSLLDAIDRQAGDQLTRRRLVLLTQHLDQLLAEHQAMSALTENLQRRLNVCQVEQRVAADRNERLRVELARRNTSFGH